MKRKTIKRIGIDLPIEIAIDIKKISAIQNIPMRKFILHAILKEIREFYKYN